MFRLMMLALPFLLKGPTKGPIKNLIGRSAFSAMIFFGVVFLLAALFVWVMVTYSLVIAFIMMGVICISLALLAKAIASFSSSRKARKVLPGRMGEDSLSRLLPEHVAKDPAMQSVLVHIGRHPMAATGIAAVIGAILAREIFR